MQRWGGKRGSESLGEALDPFRFALPDLWLTPQLQFLVVSSPHPAASVLAAALFWVVLGDFEYWLEITLKQLQGFEFWQMIGFVSAGASLSSGHEHSDMTRW